MTPLFIVTWKKGFFCLVVWGNTVPHSWEATVVLGASGSHHAVYPGTKQRAKSAGVWLSLSCPHFYSGWAPVHEMVLPMFKDSLPPQLKIPGNTQSWGMFPSQLQIQSSWQSRLIVVTRSNNQTNTHTVLPDHAIEEGLRFFKKDSLL